MKIVLLIFIVIISISCSKNYDIAIIGDSISVANGSSGISPDSTYIGLLKQNSSVYVNAVAGSSIVSGGQSDTVDFTDDARITDISSVNAKNIIIFGGINDFLQDLPLGTFGDTSKTASFYGALDYLYKELKVKSPNSIIYHITPLHTLFQQEHRSVPEFNGQNYLTDYKKAIFAVSKKYNIIVVDSDRTGITRNNISQFSDDDIHVKEAGHKMIFQLIQKEIQ